MQGETASKDEDYISIIIGALAALIVILTIIVIFVIVRHKRRQRMNRQSLKPVSDTVLNINLNNFQNNVNGKVSNGNVYNGVATEEDDHIKELNGKGNIRVLQNLIAYYCDKLPTNLLYISLHKCMCFFVFYHINL